ncbi:DNA-methyltransferase [Endozoicomonas ascidiicola]|uniref:DNA-methyltransferase n=1 Tax=Endozoicomonas ascidiicola TaxID=1698521 RepID=UPI00083516AF|nr:site-specific DNA-methyltransferase [Endozoicomonas ascidiicola]
MSSMETINGASLHQGDCLQIMMQMPGDSVDGIITDPPYSSGGMFRSDRVQTTENKYTTGGILSKFPNFPGDNRDQRSFGFWVSLWLSEAYRILKPGAPICLFTDWRQYPIMSDVLQAAGFSWRGAYVWDKKNARPNKGRFRQTTEFVLWGSKGPMASHDRGVGCLPGITSCAVSKGGRFHQTGKPVELMKEVISIVEPGGIILDPFMGSGSTGVAALETGRQFVGIEYTEHYFNVAIERLGGVTVAA